MDWRRLLLVHVLLNRQDVQLLHEWPSLLLWKYWMLLLIVHFFQTNGLCLYYILFHKNDTILDLILNDTAKKLICTHGERWNFCQLYSNNHDLHVANHRSVAVHCFSFELQRGIECLAHTKSRTYMDHIFWRNSD